MKKHLLFFLALFTFVIFPKDAFAANVQISINCTNAIIGKTATCTVMGKTDTPVSGIEGKISISGAASIASVANAGWDSALELNSNGFLLTTGTNKTGVFNIVTITVNGNSEGQASITVSGVKGSDSAFEEFNASPATKSFSVSPAPTQAPTTKASIKVTKATAAATTTVRETTTQLIDLSLTSVTVDEFPVTFENGKYYSTVNYDTESVVINATANEGVTVAGTGKRALSVGKNVVSIITSAPDGRQDTIQVIITRPADTNNYDTSLKELFVVGYKTEYDAENNIYYAKVPFTVKEVYILANCANKDVDISGAGYIVLQKGTNKAYIKVQYGDKASSSYTLEIRRTYNMIIIIALITLAIGGGAGYYFYKKAKDKKEEKDQVIQTTQELADANRSELSSLPGISINGDNHVGVGSNIVAPIPVGANIVENDQKSTDILESTIKPKIVTPIKVNKVEAPTTNVQGYADINKVQTNEVMPSAPQPQVKVIKKVVTPTVQVPVVAPKNITTNNNEL